MSYVLLVMACLIGHPTECRQDRLAVPEAVSEESCGRDGEALLPDWTRRHRGWRLTEARCVRGRDIASADPDDPALLPH